MGYCIFLANSFISWKSKKQSIISRSSAEAEYQSMASTCSKLTQLRYLLQDLDVSHPQAAELYYDNQVALHIAVNLVFHERTKDIELDCHAIRDKIQDGSITTIHVASRYQLANIFTKVIPSFIFQTHLSNMGIINLYSLSCGGYQTPHQMHVMQDIAASTKKDMQDVPTRFAHQPLATLPAATRFVNTTK